MPQNSKIARCGSAVCTGMLKSILFLFNIVFFTLGFCLALIGIYGLKSFDSFFSMVSTSSVWTSLLIIGIFMVFVALLSFWCIPKGVTWLLNMYGLIVFLLFVCVLCSSSVFMIRRDALEDTIKNGVSSSMKSYPNGSESIDLMQSTIKCCGLVSYSDWFTTEWASRNQSVPLSCCINKLKCLHLNMNLNNITDIYQEGCYKKVQTVIEREYTLIGGIGFATSILIFSGSLVSFWLARNIKRNRYEEME